MGINDYREGRYAGAIRQLTAAARPASHRYARALAQLFLAMAHQRLGHEAEARRALDAARTFVDSLGRSDFTRESPRGEVMRYAWTEWVIATIVRHEAEALIVYDPIFPADPFAR